MKISKVNRIPLTTRFRKLIGNPECGGSWLLFGDSASGKSTFLMELAKELAKTLKVDYNAYEEQDRGSMKDLMDEKRMDECKKGHFMLLNGWPIPHLLERLRKPRSAKVIIIDSIQYAEMTLKTYKEVQNEFPDKLFIYNSHADGKKPQGALAQKIRYDADVKLMAEGFKITSRSRMSRGNITEDYIVWEEGAIAYWKNI